MRARRSWIGWGIVMGLMGSPVWGAEPDSDAVRQLMKKYEQETGAEKPPPAHKPQPKPVSKPQPKPAPAVDHDREAWRSAEKCGTTACFRAYLEEYPKGRYARIARTRLEPASKPSAPAPTKSVVSPDVLTRSSFEPEMVRITGGCFQMGSPESEPDRYKNEPQHSVCVKNFEIGKYEVTQEEWEAVVGNNPSTVKKSGRYPVTGVSWGDVQIYLEMLNQKTGKQYRLPTEAEWEYACRGGVTGSRYCGGDDLDSLAWYSGNHGYGGFGAHSVGQKVANGFGLYDMSGNVMEWTCSYYDISYGNKEDKCSYKGTVLMRAVRGGGWNYIPAGVRSAHRDGFGPAISGSDLGFRLARSL